MKYFRLLVILSISLLTATAQAQHWCGVKTSPEDIDRLLTNKQVALDSDPSRRTTSYVPIRFHLIARSDGSGRISETEVLEQLCVLNEHMEPYDLQFFIKEEFNYFNNSDVYNNPQANDFFMSLREDDEALNVWIVGSAGGGGGVVTLGYYDPRNDWVVMANSAVVAGETEFTHEMGHFFSLAHTHNGWDCDQYDASRHGNPVNLSSAPCHNFAVELQDGSNCEDSGDFICDTPPDYLFGLGWSGCEFTDVVRDPNGDVVNPDERNYMSYFLNCNPDEYFFSPTQADILFADYESNSRNYLRRFPVQNTEVVNDAPELLLPDNQETTESNDVTLEWEAVENADFYLVEVDRTPSFGLDPVISIIEETSITVTDLDPERRYFWRVKAFNESSVCAAPSSSRQFITGLPTATRDIYLAGVMEISPNPSRTGTSVRLHIKTDLSQVESIHILDTQGKVLQDVQERGVSIDLDMNLSAGLYFVRLRTTQGISLEKMIVL